MPTKDRAYDEARKRLVEQGVPSYLEAVTALIGFQGEVQKQCRTVMEAYVKNYASALKVNLKSSEIQDVAWPAFAKWEGDWWGLAVQYYFLLIKNFLIFLLEISKCFKESNLAKLRTHGRQ